MQIGQSQNLVYNLLLTINNKDLSKPESQYMVNQQGMKVRKIGAARVRCLELLNLMLTLLHPSLGPLMKAQALLTGGADNQEYSPLIELSTYMNQQMRRQVLATML